MSNSCSRNSAFCFARKNLQHCALAMLPSFYLAHSQRQRHSRQITASAVPLNNVASRSYAAARMFTWHCHIIPMGHNSSSDSHWVLQSRQPELSFLNLPHHHQQTYKSPLTLLRCISKGKLTYPVMMIMPACRMRNICALSNGRKNLCCFNAAANWLNYELKTI